MSNSTEGTQPINKPSIRFRYTGAVLTAIALVGGLVAGQEAPAVAASFWNTYYNAYTTQGSLKSGVAGMISGGWAKLLNGSNATVYIRTYSPSGSWVAQSAVADTGGPATLGHGIVYDGKSKCMWTSGTTQSRSLQCQDKRNY